MQTLKYLFTAHYSDGTQYQQSADDVSVQDPKRSCFYDVDHSKLTTLELTEQDPPPGQAPKKLAVDLRNGHFFFNGVWANLFDGECTPQEVIFARRHYHHINLGSDVETHSFNYVLGWRGVDAKGSPLKQVVEILL